MTKCCWECDYHRLDGDTYHSVERCTLSGYTQKTAYDHLKVCEHFKPKSKGLKGFIKDLFR